ncbi:hypothetical protein HDU96_008917 [Phlyctochytrium bullatum]|nr:hypothetical protein HDU96_008917 [Phlyctochytrium bullatum]
MPSTCPINCFCFECEASSYAATLTTRIDQRWSEIQASPITPQYTTLRPTTRFTKAWFAKLKEKLVSRVDLSKIQLRDKISRMNAKIANAFRPKNGEPGQSQESRSATSQQDQAAKRLFGIKSFLKRGLNLKLAVGEVAENASPAQTHEVAVAAAI